MNLQEFKAWFEGFSENMTGVPNKTQWEKIKAKIATIEDKPPMTYPVFVEKYPWVKTYPPFTYLSNSTATANTLENKGNVFLSAFKELGRSESAQ